MFLTKRKDWNEPQRKMMRRAGRVYGVRGVLTLAFLTAGILAGIAVRRQVIENQRAPRLPGWSSDSSMLTPQKSRTSWVRCVITAAGSILH